MVEYGETIHDVRGLNVVVRLRKACPQLWPYLQHTDERCNWIQLENPTQEDEKSYYGYEFGKKKRWKSF